MATAATTIFIFSPSNWSRWFNVVLEILRPVNNKIKVAYVNTSRQKEQVLFESSHTSPQKIILLQGSSVQKSYQSDKPYNLLFKAAGHGKSKV